MNGPNFQLIIKPQAEADISDAVQFLEREQMGLGINLLDVLDEVFQLLASNPYLFQIKYGEIRVAYAFPFSYGIHYSIEGDSVYVHALLHFKRKPPDTESDKTGERDD